MPRPKVILCSSHLGNMGSSFSVPNANEVLQSYGSIPLLNTLAQARKVEDFVGLDDASVESIEPLLSISPQAIYEHSSLLCSQVGMFYIEMW